MSRATKVMKFGGSSLATADRIRRVVAIVRDATETHRVGVVVSAVGGTTDDLLAAIDIGLDGKGAPGEAADDFRRRHHELLNELVGSPGTKLIDTVRDAIDEQARLLARLLDGVRLLNECPPTAYDQIASLGERASAAVVGATLADIGVGVQAIDPTEHVVAQRMPGGARVRYAATDERLAKASREASDDVDVFLMPGFIGADEAGRLLTLGRNGSDHSATILGRGLGAEVVEIWTDVDGIMSADPRDVRQAFIIPELTYREAMEMAYFGARVIHPLTLVPVVDAAIPVNIRNTMNPSAPGTWIRSVAPPPERMVRAVTRTGAVSLVNVQGAGMAGVPGIAARVFAAVARRDLSVIFISQASSERSICFAVRADEAQAAITALEEDLADDLRARAVQRIERLDDVAVLSVVGEGMRGRRGLAGTLFTALADAGVNVVAIAQGSSELNISTIVSDADAHRALEAVHEHFFHRVQRLNLVIVGAGQVAGQLVEQIRRQGPELERHGVDLRIVAISNSRHTLHDSRGLTFDNIESSTDGDWRDRLASASTHLTVDELATWTRDADLMRPVLVDATDSEHVARKYEDLLRAGLHVVTPNKIANTRDLASYRTLRRAANEGRARFLYETTVGAGLPIIDSLQNLLKCGDRLRRFEGVLSGSLSFIFGEVEAGRTFSQAVLAARDRGFTEPDPREDLSGRDVARKILILAREAGFALELDDIEIEALLPAEAFEGHVDHFLARITDFDDAIAERHRRAQAAGKVLRHVGVIDDGRGAVRLVEVAGDSPLSPVHGGENIASFTTDRYRPVPLVLRGYGAGPVVTATGVFADILRLVDFEREVATS